MKIPDIAWPTFFDSYRESMLRSCFVYFWEAGLHRYYCILRARDLQTNTRPPSCYHVYLPHRLKVIVQIWSVELICLVMWLWPCFKLFITCTGCYGFTHWPQWVHMQAVMGSCERTIIGFEQWALSDQILRG